MLYFIRQVWYYFILYFIVEAEVYYCFTFYSIRMNTDFVGWSFEANARLIFDFIAKVHFSYYSRKPIY